jgi:hypothetical protein
MEVNPIAFQDGHQMIGPTNTINDILRYTAERIRESGDRGVFSEGQLNERARARWTAECIALIKDITDMFVARIGGKPPSVAHIHDKMRWWKNMEQSLTAESKTQDAEAAKINIELVKVTDEIKKTVGHGPSGGREVAAYHVLINAQRSLYSLWGSYLTQLEAAHREHMRTSVGILQGHLVALRTVLRCHAENTKEEQAEFESFCKVLNEEPLQIEGLPEQCANLKKLFFEEIYKPLQAELVKGGVHDSFVAIPLGSAMAAADMFSVRECIAAEEALLALPQAYSHGAQAQNQALVDAKAALAELRQQWKSHKEKESQVLSNPAVAPSSMAASLRVLRDQISAVKKDIDACEANLKKIIGSSSASATTIEKPQHLQPLGRKVAKVLEACRSVRRTVRSAQTFGAAFQKIAAAQHSKNIELFCDTAKNQCRSVEAMAHQQMTNNIKMAADAFSAAKVTYDEADVVDEARAAQRFDARAASEMAAHGRIERAVQLRRALTKLIARQIETHTFAKASERVIALCTSMMSR